MKNQRSIALMNWLQPKPETVLLCDSIAAASDMAFMLNGEWDACNSLVLPKCDKVAIQTAASLLQTSWCYQNMALLGLWWIRYQTQLFAIL
ncbi:MAG: hypothetical protein WBA89_15335 [Microcoleus sp.]|uniref:hypothetical protein n=1 Tax=Microcoleus sp. TaxID=44472 RepID=UPI003C72B069